MPEAVQVIPQSDFSVYVYFSDGIIKKYNVAPLLNKGVFKKISNAETFIETCTVMNGTLAWDVSGSYDPYSCIDIDPETIYEQAETVTDPFMELKPTSSL